MPSTIIDQDIRLGNAYVSTPLVIKNYSNWFESPYPVTLDLNGLNVDIQRDDDGSIFVFLSFSPIFSIGGGLIESPKEVYFLDTLQTTVAPTSTLPSVASAILPLAPNGTASYQWTSGITVGGEIGIKGTASNDKDGTSVGVEVNGSASFSYTNQQTVSADISDVGVNASYVGQCVTWSFTCQQVYQNGKPYVYNVGDPQSGLHNQIYGYRTPPAALQGAAGGVLTRSQAIWKLPPGTSGQLTFAIGLQARLIHGYVDTSWGNTSTTWVSTSWLATIDLDRATVTPAPDPFGAVMMSAIGSAWHEDGMHVRIA